MINIVIGGQGSGKTLFCVFKAYEYYKKGYTIYSNVKLNFPFKLINYDDIINCKYENAFILIDEIHQLLPARNSMSQTSRKIVDGFLSMLRKKRIILFGTTQTERKVDVRIRDEMSYLFKCEKYAYLKNKWSISHSDTLNIQIPILIRCLISEIHSGKLLRLNLLANKFFKLYDTHEIILITGLNKNDNTKFNPNKFKHVKYVNV